MPHTDYPYIACDKYGNRKNMNPFKKRIRRVRFPKDTKTFIRLGMYAKSRELFEELLREPNDKVIATQQAMP